MEPLLTPAQLAAIFQKHPKTIQRWREKGYGPKAIVVGRRWMYRPSDVQAWLDAAADRADRVKQTVISKWREYFQDEDES